MLVPEPGSAVVNEYLVGTDDELLVSDFAAAEVASGLSRLVRMEFLEAADASARLADFEAWRAAVCSPVDVQPADARLAYAFVRRFDLMLRAPDALHLAVAARLNASIATLDGLMGRAARELGIPIDVLQAGR